MLEFEYYELAVPPRYRIDLAGYMQTCDDNYWRLLKLVPALESGKPSYSGAAIEQGLINNAMAIIALQWLQIRKMVNAAGAS